MYLEINKLDEHEKAVLQKIFGNRMRSFDSAYTEACRVEVECTLENKGYDMDSIKTKDIEELSQQVDFSSDSIFQDLCELTEEKVTNYFKN